jgi:hypothetical protein
MVLIEKLNEMRIKIYCSYSGNGSNVCLYISSKISSGSLRFVLLDGICRGLGIERPAGALFEPCVVELCDVDCIADKVCGAADDTTVEGATVEPASNVGSTNDIFSR